MVRVSGLRGAYRPSNAHEDGRPVALKTDLAYTKMDQPPRQTNGRTAYQSDSVNQVLPSKTHQVDSKRDYGPLVRTNLTLKKILHRVVKLILQGLAAYRRQQGTPTAHTPAWVWQAPPVVSRLVAGGTSCCLLWGPSFFH